MNLSAVLWSLDTQEGGLMVNINDCLDNEVLVLENKALSEFFKLTETWSSLIHHLDVLSSTNLSSFLDSIFAWVNPDLMVVNIAIILSKLPDESLSLLVRWNQVSLLQLEYFLLDPFGNLDVELIRKGHQ